MWGLRAAFSALIGSSVPDPVATISSHTLPRRGSAMVPAAPRRRWSQRSWRGAGGWPLGQRLVDAAEPVGIGARPDVAVAARRLRGLGLDVLGASVADVVVGGDEEAAAGRVGARGAGCDASIECTVTVIPHERRSRL